MRKKEDSIMAQHGEGADTDLTTTVEEEEMEISLKNITAVQGTDDHLLTQDTLEGLKLWRSSTLSMVRQRKGRPAKATRADRGTKTKKLLMIFYKTNVHL